MIQLFDTHRLSYRNAKLRAWALADKTRRVNFQDYSSEDDEWNDIGTDVITDESGYLFYADGTQKIECLGVAEAAIVDVSLDGGHSYLIQFVIQPNHDPSALTAESIFTLSYKNASGQTETYNPALGPARTLPDYLLKSEYNQGDWREGTLLCPNDASDYRLTDFTKLILVSRGQYDIDTYTLVLPHDNRLRAGQVVYVKNTGNKTVTLNISGGSSITLKPYGAYILRNVFSLNQSAVFDTVYEDPAVDTVTADITVTSAGGTTANIQIDSISKYIDYVDVNIDASGLASGVTNFAVHLPLPANHSCDVAVKVHGYTGNFGIELLEGTIDNYSLLSAQAVFTAVGSDVMAYFHVTKIGTKSGASTVLNQLPNS